MGAVPKRKLSTMRKGKRRRNKKLKVVNIVNCPKCDQKKLPHQECGACGQN